MEILGLVLTVPFAAAGLATVYGLVRAPSAAEFFDRPLCWIVGHPAPGSAMRFVTEHKTPAGTLPAEVWHCVRCGHLVTLVGPYRRAYDEDSRPVGKGW